MVVLWIVVNVNVILAIIVALRVCSLNVKVVDLYSASTRLRLSGIARNVNG